MSDQKHNDYISISDDDIEFTTNTDAAWDDDDDVEIIDSYHTNAAIKRNPDTAIDQCPICNMDVEIRHLQQHVDKCLMDDTVRDTVYIDTTSSSTCNTTPKTSHTSSNTTTTLLKNAPVNTPKSKQSNNTQQVQKIVVHQPCQLCGSKFDPTLMWRLDCGHLACFECSNQYLDKLIQSLKTGRDLYSDIKQMKCFHCTYVLNVEEVRSTLYNDQFEQLCKHLNDTYTTQLITTHNCHYCKVRLPAFTIEQLQLMYTTDILPTFMTQQHQTPCTCSTLICPFCPNTVVRNEHKTQCINTLIFYIYLIVNTLAVETSDEPQTKQCKRAKTNTPTTRSKSTAKHIELPYSYPCDNQTHKSGVGYSGNQHERESKEVTKQKEKIDAKQHELDNTIAMVFDHLCKALKHDLLRYHTPIVLYAVIQQSCLLSLLRKLLRNDSIIDMTARKELYFSTLTLIRTVCKNPYLASLLTIGETTIAQLIQNLAVQADFYIRHTKNDEELVDTVAMGLCADINVAVYETQRIKLKYSVVQYDAEQCTVITNTDTANTELVKQLNALKFDSYHIIADHTADYDKTYYYVVQAQTKAEAKPRDCITRLKKELSTLAGNNTLPDGIYVRVDENRMDVMRCMITGPTNTPYAYGLFLFDIYIPDTYPNTPPQVIFKTTGNNTFRFNPNLYADGKVCLSLLGTWSGPGWSAKDSTILQVLISIQSMILVEHPYFNEPGYQSSEGTASGMKQSENYNKPVRHATLLYAMLEQLNTPVRGFEEVIRLHFTVYKPQIVQQIIEWSKLDPTSSKIVFTHVVPTTTTTNTTTTTPQIPPSSNATANIMQSFQNDALHKSACPDKFNMLSSSIHHVMKVPAHAHLMNVPANVTTTQQIPVSQNHNTADNMVSAIKQNAPGKSLQSKLGAVYGSLHSTMSDALTNVAMYEPHKGIRLPMGEVIKQLTVKLHELDTQIEQET